MSCIPRLLALGLCILIADARGQEGAAVFGSWARQDLAAAASTRVNEALQIPTRVVAVELRGQRLHRVVSGVMPEVRARALIDLAATRGFEAWYLREAGTTEAAEAVVQAPEASPGRVPRLATPARMPASRGSMRPPADRREQAPPVQTAAIIRSDALPAAPVEEAVARTTIVADGATIPVARMRDPDITLDGRVDEPVWQQVPGFDEMLVSEPDTAAEPKYGTITRLIYTEKGVYVSAVMQQPADTLVNRLSSRDQSLNRDAFHVTLDASGAGLYGYWFEVSLGGTLRDGTVVPERTVSEQWDGPWRGASAVTEDGWSAEMYLPWSMMAMPQSDDRVIGIWLRRQVAHLDETYSWPALPFNSPRFMSALQPVSFPGVEPKRSVAVFPYVSSTQDAIAGEQQVDAGFDLYFRPSSNLQLTATIKPDFGAVESDKVVVNLTAFETFFPEKRLFFLEGNEVFVTSPRSDINRFNSRPKGTGPRATPLTYEPEPTTLVNTRRIGGAAKHIDIPDGISVSGIERSKPSQLLGAVKVVGQQGAFRYGVLAAAEDDVELRGTDDTTGQNVLVEGPGRDFGVIRGIWESSGNGRKALGYIGTIVTLPGDDAMTHGIDAHVLTGDGKLRFDGQYLFSDDGTRQGHGVFSDFTYAPSRTWLHRMSLDYLDERLDISDLGFIGRNDAIVARYGVVRTQTRGLEKLRMMRNSLFFSNQWSVDGFANRLGIFSNQTFMLPNRSEVKWTLNYFPTQWDDRNSRGNGMFKIEDRWFTQVAFGSDTAKPLAWSGTLTAEQESLGGWTYGSDFGFTFKPNGRFSFDFDIRYKRRDGWLVYRSGREFATYSATDLQPTLATDFFFNARHQLRMTLQWAGIRAEGQEYLEVPLGEGPLVRRAVQPTAGSEDFTISRLTAQFRYRWEIGPLSDLFLVYTRGSNLPTDPDPEFGDLFQEAWREPIVDVFIMKLRYRFGT